MRAVTSSGRTIRITFGALACCSAIACGARSSLLVDGASTSSSSSSSSNGSGGRGAGGNAPGGGGDAPGGGLPRCISQENPANWAIERYRDQGDYERAATAVSNEPWVALKVRGSGISLLNLDVDSSQGIVVGQRMDIADFDVYPMALDVDDQRFVMVTNTDVNFEGALDLWRIDRMTGAVIQRRLLPVPAGNSTTAAAVALLGDQMVVAYADLLVAGGTIEIRDDVLGVVTTLAQPALSYTAARRNGSAVDVYLEDMSVVHAENGQLSVHALSQDWEPLAGLDDFTVSIGKHAAQFQLLQGSKQWLGPWPHTQISPPTIIRFDGKRVAISQETELTAAVGHVYDDTFQWMPILPADGAPGTGLGILPKIDDQRLGVFYLGLEIPSPEQPLRYFGRVCPR